MRTLKSYTDSVSHAVGATMDSRHTATEMVNDAGRLLFAMADWAWKRRPPLELSHIDGSEFIALPNDFGEVEALVVPNGIIYSVNLVSLSEIEHRRNYSQFDSYRFFMALAFPSQGSREEAPSVPRLEVYPANAQVAAFTMIYRARWIDLVDPTDVPNILPEYERLLLELVRAMARGIEDDAEILATQSVQHQFNLLMRHSGVQQSHMGEMRGGAVLDRRGPVTLYPHRRITVST